jgi:hypothetical protein
VCSLGRYVCPPCVVIALLAVTLAATRKTVAWWRWRDGRRLERHLAARSGRSPRPATARCQRGPTSPTASACCLFIRAWADGARSRARIAAWIAVALDCNLAAARRAAVATTHRCACRRRRRRNFAAPGAWRRLAAPRLLRRPLAIDSGSVVFVPPRRQDGVADDGRRGEVARARASPRRASPVVRRASCACRARRRCRYPGSAVEWTCRSRRASSPAAGVERRQRARRSSEASGSGGVRAGSLRRRNCEQRRLRRRRRGLLDASASFGAPRVGLGSAPFAWPSAALEAARAVDGRQVKWASFCGSSWITCGSSSPLHPVRSSWVAPRQRATFLLASAQPPTSPE